MSKSISLKCTVISKKLILYFFICSLLLNTGNFSAFAINESTKNYNKQDFKINFNSSDFNDTDGLLKDKERKLNEYNLNMALNNLIPGIAQFSINQEKEGLSYMLTSLPLVIAGEGLLVYYFYNRGGIVISPYKESNKNYIAKYGNDKPDDKNFLLYSGFLLTLYGTLISTYSSYSYHRDYSDKNFSNKLKTGRETLGELIFAPFKTENIFNFDFFPMYPLTAISSVQGDDFSKIALFWQKEKVPFMGLQVSPIQGFSLELISASALVMANATWEEIQFRGITLETTNIPTSAFSFGLAHAGNVLYPNTSIEDTTLQTAFATLFGFYSAYKTKENNYDFRRMIALHFWHNVTSAMFNYMTNPDKGLFIVSVSYKF